MHLGEKKTAASIGAVCITTYLISYFTRNLLSVCTPAMLETGRFTKEGIAALSSVYMIVYAAGQLLNGTLGDYMKTKVMAALGMIVSGVGLILFPLLPQALHAVSFGLLGFGLSMLRGPLVKTISENMKQRYAQICCVLLSVITFAGPLLAGLAAAAFQWNDAFLFAGAVSLFCAAAAYALFGLMERKGMIGPPQKLSGKKKTDLLGVFKLDHFAIYMLLAMVIEALISSIGFWIPTYLTEYLSYSTEAAGGMYSLMSLFKSLCPLLCLAMLALFKDDYLKMMGVMFACAALTFAVMPLVPGAAGNVVLLTAARVFSGFASAAMWTVYIPSLGKSGRVSGANGVLDCSGYIGASAANMALAACIGGVGWRLMPLVFGAIPLLGAVLCLFGFLRGRRKGKPSPESEA